jgi:hypothetical protein
MQNLEGKLVLIDLAFAGGLGRKVSERFSQRMFPEKMWTIDADWERIGKWGRSCR